MQSCSAAGRILLLFPVQKLKLLVSYKLCRVRGPEEAPGPPPVQASSSQRVKPEKWQCSWEQKLGLKGTHSAAKLSSQGWKTCKPKHTRIPCFLRLPNTDNNPYFHSSFVTFYTICCVHLSKPVTFGPRQKVTTPFRSVAVAESLMS